MSSGNGQKCNCGRHEGLGYFPDGSPLSAGDRAARYHRLKERLPHCFTPDMAGYLRDFESVHGRVEYAMQERGKGTGGEGGMPKGMPVPCPVYTGTGGSQRALERQGYNWHQ